MTINDVIDYIRKNVPEHDIKSWGLCTVDEDGSSGVIHALGGKLYTASMFYSIDCLKRSVTESIDRKNAETN